MIAWLAAFMALAALFGVASVGYAVASLSDRLQRLEEKQ